MKHRKRSNINRCSIFNVRGARAEQGLRISFGVVACRRRDAERRVGCEEVQHGVGQRATGE